MEYKSLLLQGRLYRREIYADPNVYSRAITRMADGELIEFGKYARKLCGFRVRGTARTVSKAWLTNTKWATPIIVRLNDGRTGGRSGPSIASVCIAAEKGTIYSVPLRFGAKLALRSSDFIFRVGR